MRSLYAFCLLAVALPLSAQEKSVPRWDARGVGPLPRQGIASIDVSDDGKEIAVGTIGAPGDPNVIILNQAGKIVRHYNVGQQWIDHVAFVAGSHEVLAVCTMPAGKAGDRPEVFRLSGDRVTAEKIKQDHGVFFHYGDHSNHATLQLARAANVTALLAGNRLVWPSKGGDPSLAVRKSFNDPDQTVSVAVDGQGWTVVGSSSADTPLAVNLHVLSPTQKWNRMINKDVAKAPAPEKGLYGTPTLPDGRRAELPQRDEKVWAPLSVAIRVTGAAQYRVAAADYQGWQRWVRSSATMKDDNQGLRFMPSRPAITIYDQTANEVRRFAPETFTKPFWCDMQFSPDGQRLYVWPHHWRCRGLAGQSILPADDDARTLYVLDITSGKVKSIAFPETISDVTVGDKGDVFAGCWNGQAYRLKEADLTAARLPKGIAIGAPSLVHLQRGGDGAVVAGINGIVHAVDAKGQVTWQTHLNKDLPKTLKPWVANARATPIVPGVWQIPGGRVESDLGGQRLIEAPDGYILIEGHSGLSFEREWASLVAVGLDPMKIKYVLATHEHGDHAPGAYLWRVVTGAKFVCSEEMAYTLQHHIPGNSGYGLHPPVPTDIVIKVDTDLDLAGLKVRAVRIPGHTFGSMAWYFEKSGKTFVAFGDLIMPRGVLGYAGSVNFSARDILSSLRKLHDLKPDYVLPGHGAVEGPGNYLAAGIDVGRAVGWGYITPEKPDPRFRITKSNVVVVGWGQHATSAAFGDVNGDGKPDVVLVSPDGAGSIVKFYLNHGGKFNDQPDREIKVPQVSHPHKIRVTTTKSGANLLIAGKNAVVLQWRGKLLDFKAIPIDLGDGNQLRYLEDGVPLVARRFGGFYAVEPAKGKLLLRKFQPEIDGPYADFRMIGKDLLTSYGQLYRRGDDGRFPKTPLMQLPREKDWIFLGVGDFNGDGMPDAALLSYGMDKSTSARLFYGRAKAELPFADKADSVINLSGLLKTAQKGQAPPLVRDTPVVGDWNGDGIDDLIVAHGQSDEVLILLGGKDGLSPERVQRINLEYRVHYEHGVYVGDFNGDGKPDLAVFGYTNTGVGAGGPPAAYIWQQ